MKRYSLIFFLTFFGVMELFSQPMCGGRPMSVRKTLPQVQTVCQLPSRQQLMKGESASVLNNADAFAVPIGVNLNPLNSGQWECADGVNVWRLAISSPNAFSLNLIFTDFYLPSGASLFIYNADTTVVAGAYSSDNNADILPTAPIPGDKVIVEYNEPDSADFQGFFNLVQVAHDFKGAFADEPTPGACQVGLTDEQKSEWGNERRAVCRIVVGGTVLCTGTLLATADHSFEPYVLTARHCIFSEKQAQSSLFYFNYDDYVIPEKQCVAGASLVAVKDNDNGFLDFALVRLNNAIPDYYNVCYAGWDVSGAVPSGGVCLHHPGGGSVAIAVDNDSLSVASYRNFDTATFFNVAEWESGATEQGSSGAPLFDANHRVVGLLAGGDSDCSYPLNDFFQMFSAAYDRYSDADLQLKHWLNTLNNNILHVDGACPSSSGLRHSVANVSLEVTPNPCTTQVTLSACKRYIQRVIITDLAGSQLVAYDTDAEHSVTVDVAKLHSGPYVCRVTFTDGSSESIILIKNN